MVRAFRFAKLPTGSTTFDQNDFIYVSFMSHLGGDIKFKTEFPSRDIAHSGDDPQQNQRNVFSYMGQTDTNKDPEEIQKELAAYRAHQLAVGYNKSELGGPVVNFKATNK